MDGAAGSEPPPSVFPGFDRRDEASGRLIGQLVELRRRRGLSQTVVAARMGTSQSALARLESGQSDARLSTVSRYVAALDADLDFTVQPRQADD
jgi:transcriptional regulator with XRE-family HTH domain